MKHPGFFPRLRLALLWPALAALAVATPLFWTLSWGPLETTSSEYLFEAMALIEPQIRDRLDIATAGELQATLQQLTGDSDLRISVIRPDGIVLADSSVAWSDVPNMDNHLDRPEILSALESGQGSSKRLSATTGLDYFYVARSIECGDQDPCVLRLARRLDRGQDLRKGVRSAALLALLAASFVVAIITLWLDRKLVRPFERLVEGARILSAGDFEHRVGQPEALELQTLAESLNHLASEVQDTIGQLASERDRLREILSALSDGILVIDEHGAIQLRNEAFERIMGPAASDSTEMVDRHPSLAGLISGAVDQHQTRQLQLELRDPLRILRASALPLPDGSGTVVAIHDETDAMRLAESRKDLVANVSHELKTPLTAIRGFAETLQDGALDDGPVAERFTQRIIEQCQRLEHLLRDLLSLSRIESLEVVPRIEPVDLAGISRQALEILDREIEARQIRVEIEAEAGVEVIGDPDDLEQLVLNLLENAVKYSRQSGLVTIRVLRGPAEVAYEVEDDGIGIPGRDLGRIFERFYRVDKARSREKGGTGLGLAIVKHVVLRHGARVEVDSQVGRGSLFRVLFPETREAQS